MIIREARFFLVVLMLSLAVGLISGCTEESPRPSAPALVSTSADKVEPLLTFIVHGDTHSGCDFRNPDVPVIHPAFVQAFTDLDPDYIFHTGDVVDNLSPLGNPYTEAHALLWSSLVDDRFFVAVGNHDNPEKLLAYLPAQETLNHTVVDQSARALFIILEVPRCWDQLDEQYQYLLTQLKDPRHDHLTHRFVFFHVAPFSHNSKVGACESVRAWGPMMEELGVDVV
nr:metallophosphoesterase [Candidatus Krumholzibacteria bacterium]